MDDDVRETKKRLGRGRQRLQFDPGTREGDQPFPHHDVLLIPPAAVAEPDQYYRFPVVKSELVNQGQPFDGARKGTYVDAPELIDPYDYSHRKVLSFVRPNPAEPRDRGSGMAFGTLPVKSEPSATACGACYVIDAQNLTFRNAWTAEEWNAIAGVEDLPAAPSADDPSLEVLVAGPRGKVFHLKLQVLVKDESGALDDLWPAGQSRTFEGGSVESVDLRYEMEIWNQLRNGAVAGRVSRRKRGGKGQGLASGNSVPLVNITSLIPDESARQPPVIPVVKGASGKGGHAGGNGEGRK